MGGAGLGVNWTMSFHEREGFNWHQSQWDWKRKVELHVEFQTLEGCFEIGRKKKKSS